MVNILSIDTTSNLASATVAKINNTTIENFSYNENNTLTTHSQKLFPIIDKSLNDINTNIKDIDIYLTTNGPGSFTRNKNRCYNS